MSIDLKSRHYAGKQLRKSIQAAKTADAKVLWQVQPFLNSEKFIPTENVLSDFSLFQGQSKASTLLDAKDRC